MSVELKVLHSFCKKKDTFEEYSIYFKSLFETMEREIKILYSLIEGYYEKYEESSEISQEELTTFYELRYPTTKSSFLFKEIIVTAFNTDVQIELINDLLKQLKERYFANKIINRLLPVLEGAQSDVFPTLEADIHEFMTTQSVTTDDSLLPCTLSVDDLISVVIERDGLLWHLNGLTDIIGAIPKKSLGLVYGYSNAGKSAFCVSACAGFAKQLRDTDSTIVYAGNEEAQANMWLRLTEAITGMSEVQIAANPEKAEALRQDNGIGLIKMFDSIVTVDQIKQLLNKYKPRVIVIDQATKVKTQTKEEGQGVLRELFNEYRELGKAFDTSIIGVTQGDATTARKKWLQLSDVYNSKVAIQGELDYAIGIGFTDESIAKKDIRYINVSKNKGNMDKCLATINADNCTWKDV